MKTADSLAVEYKVAPKTIRNDAKYAEAVDAIAKNAARLIALRVVAAPFASGG